MLAREKWQIKTIAVLEDVFKERLAQMAKHGEAMAELPDGTGPDVRWLSGMNGTAPADRIQERFREEYEEARASDEGHPEMGELTRMHLVREEIAEAFELDGDDPRFVGEIRQVAALCVQWLELKMLRYSCNSCSYKTDVRVEIKDHASILGHFGWTDGEV